MRTCDRIHKHIRDRTVTDEFLQFRELLFRCHVKNATATAAAATAGAAVGVNHSLLMAGKIRCPQKRNAEYRIIWNVIVIEYWEPEP